MKGNLSFLGKLIKATNLVYVDQNNYWQSNEKLVSNSNENLVLSNELIKVELPP